MRSCDSCDTTPDLLGIVYEAIRQVNGLRAPDDQLPLAEDLPLTGDGGALDSLALTTFVLFIERRVEELTGVQIDIVDAGATDSGFASLRTPASVVTLLSTLLCA